MLRMLLDTLREIQQEQLANVVNHVVDHVADKQEQNDLAILTILQRRPEASAREIS